MNRGEPGKVSDELLCQREIEHIVLDSTEWGKTRVKVEQQVRQLFFGRGAPLYCQRIHQRQAFYLRREGEKRREARQAREDRAKLLKLRSPP